MRKPITLRKTLAVLTGILFVSSASQAQIVAWECNGLNGNEATVNATTLNANLNTSTLSRGSGINGSSLADAFSATAWDNATLAGAITNSEYLQFTIGAQAGYQVSLSTLDANFRRSSTGPNAFQWQYSLDGFSTAGTNIGAAISYTTNPTNGNAQAQIDLTGISALQNVASGTTITIRLYGWGASAGTGTFAIGRLTGNDLAIGGTVTPAATNTSVFFGGSNLTVNEGDGTANLTVSIADFSTTNATSVDVVLSSGNAARVNGFSSQTVNWAANDGSSKTVTLTLTDDLLCNGTDALTFGLANLSGGQGVPFVGTPSSRTVTVNDNESLVDPVATAATSITTSGFDANWDDIGATTYFLDISRYSDFLDPTPVTVAAWDFPNNPDNNVADGGLGANSAATLTTVGGTGSITYVPIASSATSAATGSGWNSGSGAKYWVAEISTAGHFNLTLSSAQRSSNTGPRDWQVEYRIGTGGAWTLVPGSSVTVQNNWTSGVLTNVALPGACSDQPQLFLRWIMTSNTDTQGNTVAAGGTSAIDNIAIAGRPESYVAGYEGFNAGSATSESVTGLSPVTTYHYRIRATGGCASANLSNQISVTTSAVPVYYSRSTGSVNDPIWSDTPTGAAGPAVWTNASEMVVQSGDAVTVDANTTIKSLTVQSGATLNIDANRFLKATTGANAIQGTLNAADNSEFQVTEGSSATLALGGTASFWDFRAGMTGGVTVTGTMEIRGTLQIDDGDFDCTGATVTLRSTATSTGRLGEMSAGASYTGNLNIERYIPAGATNWRLLGSPIQSRRVNHFIDDFYTAGFPGSHFPGFTVNGNPWPSIRWYDETDTGAGQNDGLQGVSSNTQLLTPGQGFAAWCGDNLQTTAAFVIDLGNNAPVVATTPVSLPVSWTDTGSPAVDGWNLVANPLPSPIAFDQIARGADVADYVTYYDPASGNTAVWDIDLAQGTNGGTNTIQSMQGFFLKANGPAVATTVSESAKVASNDGGFFGGSGGSAAPGLRLRISSSMNAFFDEALVVFHQGSPGLDADDAEKFVFADPTAPQIATLTADDRALAINAHGGMEAGFSIPVSVDAGVSGTYVISLQQLSDLGLTCITLEDLATGTVTPLPYGAQYAFEMEATDPNTQARFILHATAPLPLYVEDALCGADPNGQATVVVNGGPVDVTWTDDLGNALLTQTGVEGVAAFTGLDAGGYRVRVTGGACGELEQTFAINAPFVLEGIGDAYPASCSDAADGSVDLMILGGVAPYDVLWSDGSADPLLIAAPGSYTVTVTDANACSWTAAYIIASAGPDPAFTMESATVTVGTPVQFTSTLAEGSHYWSFGDGASSDEASPVHSWSLPGTYTVTHAMENGGCLESTSTEVTVELSTGVAGRTTAEARAWHDGAHVVVVHAFAGGEAVRIELIDATGRVALQRSVAAQTGRVLLDAAALAPGVWFVRLQQGSEQATLRVPVVR